MLEAVGRLITSRRNFLVRASAITAAGATVAVPIVTMADAKARMDYHAKQFESAARDYYSGMNIDVRGNDLTPTEVEETGWPACFCFMATSSTPRWSRQKRS